ncbi:MAG TPA: hypothetical protein VJS91_11555 [Nitrososphaeraceae archaeon]|nr:hypothetical protein [Nitrososphaeraceae archaeon]
MKFKSQLTVIVILVSIMFGGLYSVTVQSAFAHESRLYSTGNKDYWITVGSIGEPVFVDDKSGAEAFISSADPANPLDSDANGTKMIEGLEKTLKFEISAGDKKKVFEMEPAWNDPGHYEAVFYPTVETSYTYRLFGTINNVTVIFDFQCQNAEGEGQQENSTKQISKGVTQKAQRGGFSCIDSRTDVAFPEQYVSNNELFSMINKTKGNSIIE